MDLAFDEAVDHPAVEIVGNGPLRQVEAGRSNRPVDPGEVEVVLHDRVARTVASAHAEAIADYHDLGLGLLHARRARSHR